MAAGHRLVTIYAGIVSALLPTPAGDDSIAQFVERTIQLAPWHLRMGVRMAETVLLFWLVFTVKGFIPGHPDRASLQNALNRFEKLSSPSATLIRLYRSLALLAWCEGKAAL